MQNSLAQVGRLFPPQSWPVDLFPLFVDFVSKWLDRGEAFAQPDALTEENACPCHLLETFCMTNGLFKLSRSSSLGYVDNDD